MYYDKILSPLGDFFCIIQKHSILSLTNQINSTTNLHQLSTPLTQECQKQINAYFEGKLTAFSLPLRIQGSLFAQCIYKTLAQIPYGSTISYQDLATLAGYPKASRAVGNAMKHNPLVLLIPCHRVICSDGSLGGFLLGAEIKMRLLALEKAFLTT